MFDWSRALAGVSLSVSIGVFAAPAIVAAMKAPEPVHHRPALSVTIEERPVLCRADATERPARRCRELS